MNDPHNCWGSCANPGSNCTACTNPDYFNCTKSGKCVHPDLRCDGHPQCEYGEDEDLATCHKEYIKRDLIQPYASYRCTSPMYDTMDIYGTPCDGILDCGDGSDESRCSGSLMTNYILTTTVAGIALLYLCLKYSRKLFNERKKSSDEKVTSNSTAATTRNEIDTVFKNYEDNPTWE